MPIADTMHCMLMAMERHLEAPTAGAVLNEMIYKKPFWHCESHKPLHLEHVDLLLCNERHKCSLAAEDQQAFRWA